MKIAICDDDARIREQIKHLILIQAIMERPKFLILDEPINGLDQNSVELVRGLLKVIAAEGTLVLLASHNREEILIPFVIRSIIWMEEK